MTRGVLAAGLCLAGVPARAESPPLKSIAPDAFSDNPAGIRAGNLLFHGNVVSGLIYDSNVFSSHTDIVGDRIFYVRPGLTVSTIDPNYNFILRTSLDSLEYDKNPSENRLDARAELEGKVRVQRDSDIDLGVSAARVNEPRSLTRRDLPTNAANPVLFDAYTARAAYVRRMNPLTSTTSVGYENNNYFNVRSLDGGFINLQSLDRDVVKVEENLDLKLSHRLLLFTQQRVISSDYRAVPGSIERDSIKYDSVSGIEVSFTPLIQGRFSFHFAEEHFRSDMLNASPEVGYRGELSWSPQRNLRLKAGVARDFGGVNFDLDSSGGRRTLADLTIDYDITRRLMARATFSYLHANEASVATGGSRIEDTLQYKASLAYQASRYWTFFADYGIERRLSTVDDNQFDRHVIQAGAVARF